MCGPVFLSFSRGIEPAAFWSLDNLLCWAPAGRRLGAFSSWRARCFLKELLYIFSASSFISHIPLVFLLFPPGFKAFSFSCLSIDVSLILRYWRCGRTSDPIHKKTNETQKNQLFSQSGALIISNVPNLILNNVFVCFSGMFTYMKDSRCHWFSSWKCDNYSEFQLVGTVSFININKTIRCVARLLPVMYGRYL